MMRTSAVSLDVPAPAQAVTSVRKRGISEHVERVMVVSFVQ